VAKVVEDVEMALAGLTAPPAASTLEEVPNDPAGPDDTGPPTTPQAAPPPRSAPQPAARP
jgi:hypothetical protein